MKLVPSADDDRRLLKKISSRPGACVSGVFNHGSLPVASSDIHSTSKIVYRNASIHNSRHAPKSDILIIVVIAAMCGSGFSQPWLVVGGNISAIT
jgi:hypothetical protein